MIRPKNANCALGRLESKLSLPRKVRTEPYCQTDAANCAYEVRLSRTVEVNVASRVAGHRQACACGIASAEARVRASSSCWCRACGRCISCFPDVASV